VTADPPDSGSGVAAWPQPGWQRGTGRTRAGARPRPPAQTMASSRATSWSQRWISSPSTSTTAATASGRGAWAPSPHVLTGAGTVTATGSSSTHERPWPATGTIWGSSLATGRCSRSTNGPGGSTCRARSWSEAPGRTRFRAIRPASTRSQWGHSSPPVPGEFAV